jgi:hypothetical protein
LGQNEFPTFLLFCFSSQNLPRKKGSKEKSFIDEKLCLLCGEIKNATNYRLMGGISGNIRGIIYMLLKTC